MTTVLITGCSSGFGLEAALAFARRGDTVVATMRNLAKADTLQRRVEAEGLTVELEELDVTDVGSISRACTAVTGRHGAVDVLVNNAGVGYAGPVETISIDRARALMETNFWGAMNTAREVLPRMREQRSGTIINVTSLQGLIPGTMYSGMYSGVQTRTECVERGARCRTGPVRHSSGVHRAWVLRNRNRCQRNR